MSEADKNAVWNSRHHARRTEQSGGARLRHRRTNGTRLIWRGGLFDLDRRIAIAGHRAFDGRDFSVID